MYLSPIQIFIIFILAILIFWLIYHATIKSLENTSDPANLSFFEHATMLVSDYVFEQRPNGKGGYELLWTSDSQVKITGYSVEEINKIGWLNIIHPDDREAGAEVEKKWHLGINTSQEFRVISKEGETVWLVNHSKPILVDGELEKIIGVSTDITAIKTAEQKLVYLAYYDVLTGLYNRGKIIELLSNYIEETKEDLTILSLDLDQFKKVNDSLGHSIGDKLLIAVSKWLQKNLDPTFDIGRFGGDEFIIIIPHAYHHPIVKEAIESIQKRFTRPFKLQNYQIFTSSSIGVADYSPKQITTPEILIRNADIAMFRAKQIGFNRYTFFDDEMHLEIEEKLILETDLRFAIQNKQLSIDYQPIISLLERKVIGIEALLRWDHPTFGEIPPTKFIKIAEEIGVIIEIGNWVIERAIQDFVQWKQQYHLANKLFVTINISATQLIHSDLQNFLNSIIENNNISKHEIKFELTENVFLFENLNSIQKINELIASNYKIVLDDFGTGYSSLSYLLDINFDSVKLDRSFVHQLEERQNEAWVLSIVKLFENMDTDLIIEGIETKDQLEYLLEAGCELGQGFYFCPPLSKNKINQSFFN